MEHKGMGFCPDLIRLPEPPLTHTSKLTVWARDPGTTEVLRNPPEPLSGPAGFMLDNWVMPRVGLEIPYSKCNTIRCHTPEDKYPKGKIRKQAELHCRQYDKLTPNDHDVILVSLHPASIMHNKFDTLPLLINDFARAKMLLDEGLDVLVLAGSEAMDLWAPHLRHSVKGESYGITEWRGHFWPTTRLQKRYAEETFLTNKSFHLRKLLYPFVSFREPLSPDTLLSFQNLFEAESLALDLEWNPADPSTVTRVGLAVSADDVCSFDYNDSYNGALQMLVDSAQEVVMHNGLGRGADADMLANIGIHLDPEKVRDSMLGFHLIWPQFAGLGFLDLWTFASMHSNTPNWKICRGSTGMCIGPCPIHDPAGYNAMDARELWISWDAIKPELLLRGQM
ncbi:MAG: hypothetical protein MN733_14180 [Nitrososphaera sp.]|nr:hypothetical protein [Nitrososphaera sp.]